MEYLIAADLVVTLVFVIFMSIVSKESIPVTMLPLLMLVMPFVLVYIVLSWFTESQ